MINYKKDGIIRIPFWDDQIFIRMVCRISYWFPLIGLIKFKVVSNIFEEKRLYFNENFIF